MDVGNQALNVPWYRAVIVWMALMLVESLHGTVREIFIAPRIGGLRARQWGVAFGCVLIFAIAWMAARWLGAATRSQQLAVGGLWVLLTLVFEFTLGRVRGASWMQMLADYNLARGGLMLLGLAFMFVTPMLVARRLSREKLT